ISYGNGEAQVRLEFDKGENRYRVDREVHKTRPNRATLVEVKLNGTTKALANSVKDVTAEIERLLGGITYDEIVASSVVAQKDLERLIKQRLDDRRKVINVFLNLESFNKVQDQLDSERNGIEGTSRTPGHLTVEGQRLETLNEQLNEYKETSVQLQVAQFEDREQRLQAQITETNKKVTFADESRLFSSEKPRRIWSYLMATAAFGAGAILSFILAPVALTIALGSLAVVFLLLLTRQIVSLSQQAEASKQQQDRLASAQLL